MTKLIGSNFVLPPEGEATLTLCEIKEIVNSFFKEGDNEDSRMRLQWSFDVDGVEGAELAKFSSKKLSVYKGKMSNALLLSEALLGRSLDQEERRELDTEMLIGKKMYAVIEHVEKENNTFARIVSFKALKS